MREVRGYLRSKVMYKEVIGWVGRVRGMMVK